MNTVGRSWTRSFSPYARISQVPVEQVFDAVRYVLFRWGFIGCFRADNGAPFGDPTRSAPSALHLCLRGFGIQVKVNPPRSPRKNAKVERAQGTTYRWADPATCADYEAFQHRLNEVVVEQREEFQTRVCHQQTRAQYYPALFDNSQKFHPDGFFAHLIYEYLATGHWQRKVSKDGTTRLLGQNYQVGRKYRGQAVSATFDPLELAWVFKDHRGVFLQQMKAANLTADHILSFSTCQ